MLSDYPGLFSLLEPETALKKRSRICSIALFKRNTMPSTLDCYCKPTQPVSVDCAKEAHPLRLRCAMKAHKVRHKSAAGAPE